MRRYSLSYLAGQGVKGLFRNGVMSVAAIAVLMACLAVLGSFSLLIYNLNINLDEVALLNEIIVWADYDASDDEVEAIGEKIDSLDNIESVTFVSKEEALESERDRYGEYSHVFDYFSGEDNPLPDVFHIKYSSLDGVSTLVYELSHIDGVRKVSNRSDIAQTIESIKSGVYFIFVWFLAILFVVSVFIIINAIRAAVESRSREIAVMRYVGATNRFMTAPFAVEGFLIGLIAAALGYLVQWYLYSALENIITGTYKFIHIVPFMDLWSIVLCGFIFVGIFCGLLGSSISLRKYLKV